MPRKYTEKEKLDAFWQKVNRTSDCWTWQGAVSRSGYGSFRDGKIVQAHIFSYKLHYDDYDNLKFVCHTCDNKKCVNPSHLFLGSRQDNVNDMLSKDRQARLYGETNFSSKLTAVDVKDIRDKLHLGMTQASIAKAYGVTQATISLIKRERTWTQTN